MIRRVLHAANAIVLGHFIARAGNRRHHIDNCGQRLVRPVTA